MIKQLALLTKVRDLEREFFLNKCDSETVTCKLGLTSSLARTLQARPWDPVSSRQHGCLSLLLLIRNLNLKAWHCLGFLVVSSRANLTVCCLVCHGGFHSERVKSDREGNQDAFSICCLWENSFCFVLNALNIEAGTLVHADICYVWRKQSLQRFMSCPLGCSFLATGLSLCRTIALCLSLQAYLHFKKRQFYCHFISSFTEAGRTKLVKEDDRCDLKQHLYSAGLLEFLRLSH